MSKKFVCARCEILLAAESFYVNKTGGKEYRRRICRGCENKARTERGFSSPEKSEKFRARTREASLRWRKNPNKRAIMIVQYSRSSDRKKGLRSDIDVAWVSQQISAGCSYCGETGLIMTLDRVDNSIGHLKSNVVPACVRCNYIRRDMPHEAWLILVPQIRVARERGAFGNWTCQIIRRVPLMVSKPA